MSGLEKLRSELAWRASNRVKTLGGIDTEDMQGLVQHLDAMIAVNKASVAALTEIADPRSPFDSTGEPFKSASPKT